MHPYAPRPIRSLGVRAHGGWRLKHYTIVYGPHPLDEAGFAVGLDLVLEALPDPAIREGRPGVGFVIAHQGRGADYVVLAWWDRENELPVRLVVREQREGAPWRPARADESFCVWDLQVIGFERDAYVGTVLAPEAGADAVERYFERRLDAAIGATA